MPAARIGADVPFLWRLEMAYFYRKTRRHKKGTGAESLAIRFSGRLPKYSAFFFGNA
jgi:hypothetical protein